MALLPSKTSASPGDTVVVGVPLGNFGNYDAQDVRVEVNFDDSLQLTGQSSGAMVKGNQVVWQSPVLKQGSSNSYSLEFKVKDGVLAEMALIAAIAQTSTKEQNYQNNTAAAQLLILQPAASASGNSSGNDQGTETGTTQDAALLDVDQAAVQPEAAGAVLGAFNGLVWTTVYGVEKSLHESPNREMCLAALEQIPESNQAGLLSYLVYLWQLIKAFVSSMFTS